MRPRQTSQGSDDDGNLPVFISPTELKYYADDISAHKQVVTIYNPYSYTLKYKGNLLYPEDFKAFKRLIHKKFHVDCRMIANYLLSNFTSPSVLCTAPRKYHVIESEGLIKSHCRIDVVIRHKEPLEESSIDKFQIQLFDHGSSAVRGHKQVISQVLPGKPMVSTLFFVDFALNRLHNCYNSRIFNLRFSHLYLEDSRALFSSMI